MCRVVQCGLKQLVFVKLFAKTQIYAKTFFKKINSELSNLFSTFKKYFKGQFFTLIYSALYLTFYLKKIVLFVKNKIILGHVTSTPKHDKYPHSQKNNNKIPWPSWLRRGANNAKISSSILLGISYLLGVWRSWQRVRLASERSSVRLRSRPIYFFIFSYFTFF